MNAMHVGMMIMNWRVESQAPKFIAGFRKGGGARTDAMALIGMPGTRNPARAELRHHYLGWTILQRSCELFALAEELGDSDLVKHLRTLGLRAAKRVGASRGLVARMRSDAAKQHRTVKTRVRREGN
jgi:hypothetical protein